MALCVLILAVGREYLVPMAVAFFVYLLINAFAASLRRTPGIGPVLPVWLTQVLAVVALFGLMLLSARMIAQNVAELGDGMPSGQSALLAQAKALIARLGLDVTLTAGQILDRLAVDQLAGWVLRTAQGLISDVALVFLYVLFLLIDERFYDAKLRALVPNTERRGALKTSIARIGTEVRVYLWLMTLISLGVAVATYVFCSAAGLSGAGFWAGLAFVLNFVPTIGSIMAVVLPAIYGILTLNDPVNLAILIAGLAATQFIAGEIVLPRVMGSTLNLSSFVILVTLVLWGALWGPAGMFMAIPITVSLVMVAARFDTTRPIAIILSKDGNIERH